MRGLLLVGLLAGCPEEEPPPCITVDLACQAGYVPTYDNVFENTLSVNCGSTQSACHSATGRAGGLSFADQPTAYALLLQEGRVKPFDPACSEMIVRTSSPGHDYQMPPGDPLSPEERCALIQWVQNGAMQ